VKPGVHNAGHRYGCWGLKRGGNDTASIPASVRNVYASDHVLERRQIVNLVTTPWLDIACGHTLRHSDMACTDCPHLGDGKKTFLDLQVGDKATTNFSGIPVDVEIVGRMETKYSQSGVSYRVTPAPRNTTPHTYFDAAWFTPKE
jgi:hypothetical protein